VAISDEPVLPSYLTNGLPAIDGSRAACLPWTSSFVNGVFTSTGAVPRTEDDAKQGEGQDQATGRSPAVCGRPKNRSSGKDAPAARLNVGRCRHTFAGTTHGAM
jgi:hypothetical protein